MQKKTKQNKITFKDLVRQNTGISMMDSGGSSGRQWQQPLPSNDIIWNVDKGTRHNGEKYEYFNCTIPLHVFLENTLEIDQELTLRLKELQETDGSTNVLWSSGAAGLLAEDLNLMDYEISDSSYNHENDLSQDFQYAVIGPASEKNYYFDSSEVLILLETHNGADIRGGYSDVVVCRYKNGESSGFFDLCCGISVESAWNSDGQILMQNAGKYPEVEQLGEIRTDRWESGYSNNPTNTFGDDVKQVIGLSEDKTKLHVELKNGLFCTVYAEHRSEYC